jgi:hypothetical protein
LRDALTVGDCPVHWQAVGVERQPADRYHSEIAELADRLGVSGGAQLAVL